MSGVTGVTVAVRTAIAAAVTATGLACRKYDTWDIRAGSIATLGLIRWGLGDSEDQAYGFQTLTVPVIIYQVVGNSIDISLAQQETNVEKVINGLGANRTLGGKVPNSGITSDPSQSYYREPNGAAYSVVTFDLTVTPFANTGA